MPWIIERVRSPTGGTNRSMTKISKIEHRHSTAFRRDYLKFAKSASRASSVDGLITHPVALVTNNEQYNADYVRLPSIQRTISSTESSSLKDAHTRLNFESRQREVNDVTKDANGWYPLEVVNSSEVHQGTLSPKKKDAHQVNVPQIDHEHESSSSSWTTKKGPKRAVSWMSPIKTVSSFDSSSCPVTLSSSKSERPMKNTRGQKFAKKGSSNVQNLCDLADARIENTNTMVIRRSEVEPQTLVTRLAVDDDLLSPTGVMEPVNTNGIWRRDPGKPVALNIGTEHEATPADDDDELMCITFTPSDDADDLYRCDSPVAADPEDIELGLVQNGHGFASQSCPTKQSHATTDQKMSQQKHRTIFSQLLTFLLALACLSGQASRVLSRYDVPERIVSLVRAETDFEMRTKMLRRKYNESTPDVFRTPGIFLDTRQNMVGVWLK